jgi:predicted N-acetyltransferase YhbS
MPKNIYIRPIKESDAAAVKLLSLQLGYQLSNEETIENIKEVLSNKDQAAFVACKEELIIGWIHIFRTVRLESKSFIEIGGLVIDENYRKKGVGKLLVNAASELAREKHVGKIRARCNKKRIEAHQFYRALGFAESKEQKVFELDVEKQAD